MRNLWCSLLIIILLIAFCGCNFGAGVREEPTDPEEVVFESDYEVYSGKGDDFFIAIHCEPGRMPLSMDYVEQLVGVMVKSLQNFWTVLLQRIK